MRKGRDSNSRGTCAPSGFQDRANRPLWHPSNLTIIPGEKQVTINKSKTAFFELLQRGVIRKRVVRQLSDLCKIWRV